jgi:hypothetical protein
MFEPCCSQFPRIRSAAAKPFPHDAFTLQRAYAAAAFLVCNHEVFIYRTIRRHIPGGSNIRHERVITLNVSKENDVQCRVAFTKCVIRGRHDDVDEAREPTFQTTR